MNGGKQEQSRGDTGLGIPKLSRDGVKLAARRDTRRSRVGSKDLRVGRRQGRGSDGNGVGGVA